MPLGNLDCNRRGIHKCVINYNDRNLKIYVLANHYLSLQSNGIEGLVSLNNSYEQADPCRGAESAAHLRHECDAAYKTKRTPAPVLLPGN